MIDLPKKDIDSIVFDILKRSKSLDVFPTPVDQIVQYCELNQTSKSDFHSVPNNYFAKNVDAFQRMMKKILGALDREQKTIYIDPLLPGIKQGFIKLHEVGHDALPWQKEVSYLDDEFTLNLEVKEQFEAEANYFASSSLFQLTRFEDEMKKLPLEIGTPIALAKKFGGSIHAAIRRYAELSKKRCALIVLENKTGNKFTLNLRNSFQSPSFTSNFGEVVWPQTLDTSFPFILEYSRGQRFHKNGSIDLLTLNGFQEFQYHYFNNQYNVFVLIIPYGEINKSRTKIYVTTSTPGK